MLNRLLSEDDNGLAKLLASTESLAEIIDQLYWSALARAPTEEERTTTIAYFERAGSWRSAIEDVAWSLINSKEFMLRR